MRNGKRSVQKKFAVFDIDGTLIRWQLYHAIANELAKSGVIAVQSSKQIHEARMVWKNRSGNESFKEYEHALVREFYRHLDKIRVADFQQAVDRVYNEYKDQSYTYTRDLIHKLKSEGYVLLAISGSQQEIITKLAQRYGFDEAIGTEYEQKDGYFTGHETSPLGRKGEVLNKLIAKYSLTTKDSIAVGDSRGDIDMFKLVERPIAFNPELDLYHEALVRGWKIVVERKNVIYELENHDGKYTLA